MATSPIPVPQQQPGQMQQQPSVAANIPGIAREAQAAQQDKPGVTTSQMGEAPKQQGGGEKPTVKRAVLSVLGAAAGMGPMVQKINQQHNQQVQVQNQHVIDTIWNAHQQQTEAMNKVEQYKQIIQDIDQHWNEANNLPDDDPTKMQKVAYLSGAHKDTVDALKQAAQVVQSSNQTINGLMADKKNQKIMQKAVGYDEKQANAPERQQLIAAIRKTGASAESADLQAQYAQGQSTAQKGLTPAVTDQVLKSATEQAQIEGRGQVQEQKGEVAKDVAKIRAGSVKGKTGIQFDQGVPYAWTAPDGKNYAENDPDMPPEGKMLMASAKAARKEYEKTRQSTNPAAMLRAQTGWANYLMHSQGIDEKGNALPGTMQTDTGQTVGSTQAANVRPTGQERQRADLAASAKEQIVNMKDILNRRSDLFGPAAGRKTDFTQWIGSQDPDAQAFQAAARITADHLAGVFGGRSEAALEGIYKVIGKNKTNPAAAIAALQKMDQAATTIQKKGTVRTVGSSTQIPKAGAPASAGGAANDPLGILK